ncbi:unnamed protein product, partial [Scytosiphon promiscuus]
RYAILPLSNNSGLIGWVPSCDTMHQLIKQYRESKVIITVDLEQIGDLRYTQKPIHFPIFTNNIW